jgi:hypothetical protein
MMKGFSPGNRMKCETLLRMADLMADASTVTMTDVVPASAKTSR